LTENEEILSADIKWQVDEAIKQVQKLQQYANMQPMSLDQPVGINDEGLLGEVIADTRSDSVEEIVERRILQQEIATLLTSLTERERHVIIARFGLYSSEEMTLEAIGQNLKLTRERIRQIQSKVIRKLGHPRRARKLMDFLEIPQNEHSGNSMSPTQPDSEPSA